MSLRERMRSRPLPVETVRFPADTTAWARAHAELEEAAAALLDAQRRGPPAPEVLARREAAQVAVDALECTEFVVRALAPADWEALVSQHPPVDGAKHGEQFEPGTFYPALLAETVTEHDEAMSAAEWDDVFRSGEGLTLAEKNTLLNTTLGLNTRASVVSAAVGKGSAQTSS